MRHEKGENGAGWNLRRAAIAGAMVTVVSGAMGWAQAPPSDSPTDAEWKIIEQYLNPLPTKVQAAIAILGGDTIRFLGAEKTPQGVRTLDNRAVVFEIGSITKIFTATLLARQVQAGALRLDEPVQKFLPFVLKAPGKDGVDITLKHLASHTSGMRHQPPGAGFKAWLGINAGDPFRNYDRAWFEKYLKKNMVLDFVPGTRYRYSNMGMSLVGLVMECRSGKSYEALLQEDLFKPLRMTSSTTLSEKVRARVVPGVRAEGEAAGNWDMAALAPAGGIKTSAEDFARFVQGQFEPDEAAAMTQAPVFKIEDNYQVGLGWHIIQCKSGEVWLNHGGGMGGYTAIVDVNRHKKCAVVILSNLGNAYKSAENITLMARDLMYGLEARR